MNNLTIKQKVILGVIIGIMLIVIGIYGYISLHPEEELDISEMANNEIIANSQIDSNNQITDKNANSPSGNIVNSMANVNGNFRTR